MQQARIDSVCECQAVLLALLDTERHVLAGWASSGHEKERCPAHSIGAHQARFDVGWACPFCGRNTLRRFDPGALVWSEAGAPAPSAHPLPAPPKAPGPGPETKFPAQALSGAPQAPSTAPARPGSTPYPSMPPPKAAASVPPAAGGTAGSSQRPTPFAKTLLGIPNPMASSPPPARSVPPAPVASRPLPPAPTPSRPLPPAPATNRPLPPIPKPPALSHSKTLHGMAAPTPSTPAPGPLPPVPTGPPAKK